MSDQQDRAEAVRCLKERVHGSDTSGIDPDVVAASREERERLVTDPDSMPELGCELWLSAPGDKDVADRVAERAKRARRRRAKLVALLKRHWWKVPVLVVAVRFITAYRDERTR